jgi:tetratricopeptide (TPR) repeat protein
VLPKTCLAQSNSSEKIGELLESIRDHPTAGAYNTLGVLYAQEDRVPCAITAFESSLRLQNQSWEAHYNLAVALLRKGDRARAGRELQTAVGQKPDSVSSRFALGTVLEDERKLGEAEEQFRSTVELDPHFTPGALKLSRVFIKEGKPGAAVAALEEALKQKRPIDEVESLQAALGVSYAENGEIEKGQAMLKELVAAHPNSVEEHFQLGLLLSRTGQLTDQEAAITQFREALSLDQSLDAARLSLGQALISLQKYSEAVPVLLVYTSHQPQDAQGFYALGLAHQELNNPRAAIQDLRRSVGLDGGDAASRLALGKLLASNGYTAAAIRHLEAAERLNPSDAEVHGELVSLLEKAGEKERGRAERDRVAVLKSNSDRDREIAKLNEQANQSLRSDNAKAAAENYRKAIELNPRDAKLHYNLSLALDRLPDIAAERMELQRAVELDPKLAVAQNQLGLIALRRGQHTEAEARFKKALEAAPAFAEAQSNLGVLYSQLGKNEEAAALFQQALKNDPDYSKARVNYGLLLAQQGTLSAAEQQFRTAIQINNDDADAYAALGMLLAKTDRGNDALQCFRKAVSLQPNSAQAHLNLGIALLDQFDRPGGFKEFSEAERLDPDLAAAHYNLGRFYFETGKYDDADRELATTVRLQPDYSSALYFLALTAKQENQPERSTELLRKVIALRPDNADAQYLLGQSLEHSGNDSAAIRHWKAAVQADPNHSQALYNLAKSLGRMHDPEAKQYQDRFDALQKNQQVADRVSELGNFALEAANAQNWPQALQQMNEAIELCGNCPQSAHLHKNLGLFYGRTGNIGEAKKELRTALRLAPNDADAQSALAALERTPQEQLK